MLLQLYLFQPWPSCRAIVNKKAKQRHLEGRFDKVLEVGHIYSHMLLNRVRGATILFGRGLSTTKAQVIEMIALPVCV